MAEIDTLKLANEYRQAHWFGVIQEKQSSGLTTREYCKSAGIKESAYYYWQRRLRKVVALELMSHEHESDSVLSSKSIGSPPQTVIEHPTNVAAPQSWTLCTEAPVNNQRSQMTIRIGSCEVQVDETINPDLLAKVCRTLVSLC